MASSGFFPWIYNQLLHPFLNSSKLSDAYMHQWTGPSLVQTMICRLVGTKPLSQNQCWIFVNWALVNWTLGPLRTNSVKIGTKPTAIVSEEDYVEKVVCKIAFILYRPQFVRWWRYCVCNINHTPSVNLINISMISSLYHRNTVFDIVLWCIAIQMICNNKNTKSIYWPNNTSSFHFYPRPVLAFGYCRCLRLCVCVSVCLCVHQPRACPRHNSSHVQVRTTKFGKFGQNMENNLVKVHIVIFGVGVGWGVGTGWGGMGCGGGSGGGLTLTFKVKINLKSQIYPISSLSTP